MLKETSFAICHNKEFVVYQHNSNIIGPVTCLNTAIMAKRLIVDLKIKCIANRNSAIYSGFLKVFSEYDPQFYSQTFVLRIK